MGKARGNKSNQQNAPKVGLEEQIMKGKVAKNKSGPKIRLRKEEESVIFFYLIIFSLNI